MSQVYGFDRFYIEQDFTRYEWVGEVVSLESDGDIKVMIDPLFKGLKKEDLPLIHMSGSTGIYIRPQIGDKVVVQFRNSIYEGFYTENLTRKNKSIPVDNLSSGFVIDMDKVKIYGKYDGTYIVEVADKKVIEVDILGKVTIDHKSLFELKGNAVVPSVQGSLNCLGLCMWTGYLHTGKLVTPE